MSTFFFTFVGNTDFRRLVRSFNLGVSVLNMACCYVIKTNGFSSALWPKFFNFKFHLKTNFGFSCHLLVRSLEQDSWWKSLF